MLFVKKKFKIFRENETSKHELGINKYSFIHHVCPDSFYMTDLYHTLDYDEMALIIKNLYKGVTYNDQVKVIYQNTKPTNAIMSYFITDHKKEGTIFAMLTNFNTSIRKFESKVEDPDNQLARWYSIRGDRLVYRKDIFSKMNEELKLKSHRKSDIIKLYLFDDNSENDFKIESLIENILKKRSDDIDTYFARIYQIQNYLMNNQTQNAGIALEMLEDYFSTNHNLPRNLKIYLMMVRAEYEVYTRL